MSWELLTACSLHEHLRNQAYGLLVAAVDTVNRSITVLACVPAAGADDQQTADALSVLLPAGLAVVGKFSAPDSSSWRPTIAASHAIPAVRAFRPASDTKELSWTLNDQPIKPTVTAAASSVNDAGGSLNGCAPGFIPLRCHLKVQLPIVHSGRSEAATNGNADVATISGSNNGNLPQVDDVAAAICALSNSLLKQEQLVLAQELDSTTEQPAVPVIIGSSSSSTGSVPTVGEAVKSSKETNNPCTSWLPLQQSTFVHSHSKLPAPMFEYAPAQGGKASRSPPTQQMSAVHPNLETCELKLMPHRQQLHKLLGLPDNVPMLKEANALLWSVGAAGEGAGGGTGAPGRAVRLKNVHEALTPPGFGGQVYLIDGVYEYYHYMQVCMERRAADH
eukprot:gene1438-1779_t